MSSSRWRRASGSGLRSPDVNGIDGVDERLLVGSDGEAPGVVVNVCPNRDSCERERARLGGSGRKGLAQRRLKDEYGVGRAAKEKVVDVDGYHKEEGSVLVTGEQSVVKRGRLQAERGHELEDAFVPPAGRIRESVRALSELPDDADRNLGVGWRLHEDSVRTIQRHTSKKGRAYVNSARHKTVGGHGGPGHTEGGA